jgi:predicted outer membrane repeat protein
MWFLSLLASWKSERSRSRRLRPARPRSFRLRLEVLEDRCVPSTLNVTSNLDNGAVGTLRWAVAVADASPTPDTIVIHAKQPIVLTQGQLVLSASMTVEAAAGTATISGDGLSRVFEVDHGASVTLSELNITDGNAASGGGVLNSGTLRVTKCTLTDNSAQLDGGAIDNARGTLTVANSTLSGNSAEYGGAIYDSGTLTVGGSTLSDNSASMEGGAIATLGIGRGFSPDIGGCTFSNNSPTSLWGGPDGARFFGEWNVGLPKGAVVPPPVVF